MTFAAYVWMVAKVAPYLLSSIIGQRMGGMAGTPVWRQGQASPLPPPAYAPAVQVSR